MLKAYAYLQSRLSGDKGATMVEYGIMVALIAVVSVLVIGALGQNVFTAFDTTQQNVGPGPGPGAPGAAAN